MSMKINFCNNELEIDFESSPLYVIQARNGTCKTTIFNLLKSVASNKESELHINNDVNVDIDKEYNMAFYSYIEETKLGNNPAEKLSEFLKSKEVYDSLVIGELESLRKEKNLIKLKDELRSFFECDFSKLNSISYKNDIKSAGETFLTLLSKYKLNHSEREIVIELFNNLQNINDEELIITSNNISNMVDYDENSNLSEEIKRFNKSWNSYYGKFPNSNKENDEIFEVMKKSGIEHIRKVKIDVLNSFISELGINNIYLEKYIEMIFEMKINDVEINDFIWKEFINFLKDTIIIYCYMRSLFTNNKIIIEKLFNAINNPKVINKFLDRYNKIVEKFREITSRSKLNLIEGEFTNVFGKTVEIKRKKVLDFIMLGHDASNVENIISIFVNGIEIKNDNLMISDGERNIMWFLFYHISLNLCPHRKLLIFDDVTISFDRSNQISLIMLLLEFIKKGHKILLFSHDSYFVKNLKRTVNLLANKFDLNKLFKSKIDDCFFKLEKIDDQYYILKFELLDNHQIMNENTKETKKIPLKICIFREQYLKFNLFDNDKEEAFKKIFSNTKEPLNVLGDEIFSFLKIDNKFHKLTWEDILKDYTSEDKKITARKMMEHTKLNTSMDLLYLKFNLLFLSRLMYKELDRSKLEELYNESYVMCDFIHDIDRDLTYYIDYSLDSIINIFNKISCIYQFIGEEKRE